MLSAFAKGKPEKSSAHEPAETPADAQQPGTAPIQAEQAQPPTDIACQDGAIPAEDITPVEDAPKAVAAAAPVPPPMPAGAARKPRLRLRRHLL